HVHAAVGAGVAELAQAALGGEELRGRRGVPLVALDDRVAGQRVSLGAAPGGPVERVVVGGDLLDEPPGRLLLLAGLGRALAACPAGEGERGAEVSRGL